MVPTPAADHLRARAATLRSLARNLRDLPLDAVSVRAGGDTWLGATAERCADDVRAFTTSLAREADELVATARAYERRADELAALEAVRLAAS